jgi:chemotaxis protein MotB
MGKKKRKFQAPPPDDDSSIWLISYADLMTLIACFFILMMAFANFDPVSFDKKAKIISQYFKERYKSTEVKLDQLQQEVARHPEVKKMLKISLKDGALIMAFSSTVLFEKQEVKLSEKNVTFLDSIIDIVKSKDPNFRILVEGHTDDIPPAKDSPFSSNWALSAARAAAVLERFEFYGFHPKKMVAIGLADTKPLAPNRKPSGNPIEENMKMNRRVVIKVLKPKDKKQTIKMGLGVYFEEDSATTPELPASSK